MRLHLHSQNPMQTSSFSLHLLSQKSNEESKFRPFAILTMNALKCISSITSAPEHTVCVCARACVCMYVCTYVCIYVSMYVRIKSGNRIPVGARFSAPVQTGPGAHPASYIMCTGLFRGGKAAGAWR